MVKRVQVIGIGRVDLERLRDEVGRLFLTLKEATETEVPPPPGAWLPPFDLCECEAAIVIRVELPGVNLDSIKLSLTGEYLKLQGEKRRVPREHAISHLCSERSWGVFSRVIPMRWEIQVAEATAELKDGLLTIRIPKVSESGTNEFKVPVRIIE